MGLYLKKAQVGIEFIILIGILTFISMMVIGAIMFYLKDLRSDEIYYDLKGVGSMIRNEVYMAASVEDGYSRSFFLRDDINYSITELNKSILISAGNNSHVSFVEVDWTGNFQRGWNNISKQEGVIYVN